LPHKTLKISTTVGLPTNNDELVSMYFRIRATQTISKPLAMFEGTMSSHGVPAEALFFTKSAGDKHPTITTADKAGTCGGTISMSNEHSVVTEIYCQIYDDSIEGAAGGCEREESLRVNPLLNPQKQIFSNAEEVAGKAGLASAVTSSEVRRSRGSKRRDSEATR